MSRKVSRFRGALFDVANSRGVFSGQDLSLPDASALCKASGQRDRLLPVPSVYRQPVVSLETAMRTASEIMRKEAAERSVGSFGSVQLYAESPLYFTFILPLADWQAAGRVPGGLMCAIDKLDGTVWTTEDQEEYFALLASV